MVMNTYEAVLFRIKELCELNDLTINGLSYKPGLSQSTLKSITNGESTSPGIVTLKKICDGLDISLYDFFDTDYFRNLEQELK